jgi:hypothetical protein
MREKYRCASTTIYARSEFLTFAIPGNLGCFSAPKMGLVSVWRHIPIVLVVLRPRLGTEAVCQDGRGPEWRRQSARDSPVPGIQKTAEDDDDEKDSEMTLDRYYGTKSVTGSLQTVIPPIALDFQGAEGSTAILQSLRSRMIRFGFQCERLAVAKNHSLHPESGRTSSDPNFSTGEQGKARSCLLCASGTLCYR